MLIAAGSGSNTLSTSGPLELGQGRGSSATGIAYSCGRETLEPLLAGAPDRAPEFSNWHLLDRRERSQREAFTDLLNRALDALAERERAVKQSRRRAQRSRRAHVPAKLKRMGFDDDQKQFALDEAIAKHYARQQEGLPPMPPAPSIAAQQAHYSACLRWVRQGSVGPAPVPPSAE